MTNMLKTTSLDLSSLSYSDIQPGVAHYQTRIVKKVQNPNHTWSEIREGYNLYKTPVGDLTESEWNEIAIDLVKRHGDEALLEKIKDHVRKYCRWLKTKEFEHYCLKCLIDRAYEAWAERGEFEL